MNMRNARLGDTVAMLLLGSVHGLAATLSLAPFNYPLLAWVAPWPLFYLAWKFRDSWFKLVLAGMASAFFVCLFAFNWLLFYFTTLGDAPFALHLVLFLVYAVLLNLKIPAFLLLFGLSRRARWRPWMPPTWLVAGALGVFTDVLAPQIFPWYWGNLLAGNPCYVQLVEYTGIFGLSFLLFAGSCWLYKVFCMLVALVAGGRVDSGSARCFRCLRRWLTSAFIRKRLLPVPFMLLALLLWGGGLKQTVQQYQQSLPTVRVAMLQPNAPLEMSGEHAVPPEVIDGLIQQTLPDLAAEAARAAECKLDLIVLPEAAIPYYSTDKQMRVKRDDLYLEDFDRMARHLARRWQAEVYLNDVIVDADTEHSSGRKIDRDFNASVLYSRDGRRGDTYRKQILLVFGEYFPFGGLFAKLGLNGLIPEDLRENYGRGPTANLIAYGHQGRALPAADRPPAAMGVESGAPPQQGCRPISGKPKEKRDYGHFLPLICYEILFPDLVRTFWQAARNPDFIVNQTQDGWFGDSMESFQHYELGRIRAIETRRAIARCTNSGTSGFVDLAGNYVKPLAGPVFTAQGTTAFQVWDVPVNRGQATFYTRWGNIWMILPAGAFLLPAARRWYRHRQPVGRARD